MPLPKYRNKLHKLFNQITDESLKFIISEVVTIEQEYRSSTKFPIKKIEDVVDAEANRLDKINNNIGGENEI